MTPLAQSLRLCVIQHHPLETPGYVLNWAQARGMQVRVLHAWETNYAGNLDEFDAVILLGGPYSVQDASSLLWLAQEISWLKSCVAVGVPIFGICLGAQILAHCLGAQVEAMAAQGSELTAELGWVKVKFLQQLATSVEVRPLLQWHQDSFQIPLGAKRLAHSVLGHCNQGFKIAERRLMGVQFHPEWSAATLATLIDGLADAETAVELRAALGQTALFEQQQALCAALLDFWLQRD